MSNDHFEQQLAQAFEQALTDMDTRSKALTMHAAPADVDATLDGRRRDAERLARELLKQAIECGLQDIPFNSELQALGGGAAADFVIRARAGLSLIIKVQNDPKLRQEAQWLKKAHEIDKDTNPWTRHLPRVFADQLNHPPYAYAMEDFRTEDGFRDLATWIFDGELLPGAREAQARALVEQAVDVLTNIYRKTINNNSKTNLQGEAYLGRIRNRMEEAARLFEGFDGRQVLVGNSPLKSWRSALDTIEAHSDCLQKLAAPFETMVHGDAHPGNFMIRLSQGDAGTMSVDLRIIDPKGWAQGDYLFDLTKLAHFLDATGPLERWQLAKQCRFNLDENYLRISSVPDVPAWLNNLVGLVRSRAEVLAHELGDNGASLRFELGMASNLLGLVGSRYKKDPALAVALYFRGIGWLNNFVDKLVKPI